MVSYSLGLCNCLSPSDGNTVVLNKIAYFVPLPKLLSFRETASADLPFHHVFRLHGIPSDIVAENLSLSLRY